MAIIGVDDVPSTFRWYQSLFGQPDTQPGHPNFGQILDSEGTLLLCLHQWGAHEAVLSENGQSPVGARLSADGRLAR